MRPTPSAPVAVRVGVGGVATVVLANPSCVVDGDQITCACSHDGVATFECSEQVMGSCDTLLYAGCCLSG